MNTAAHWTDALCALASYLGRERDAILLAWQQMVDSAPDLVTGTALSRTQFNDHIPGILDAFEHRLCAINAADKDRARAQQLESAAEHGVHRWQQGYDQRETMREWGHLHVCVLDALERYALATPDIDPRVMVFARRVLARLCSDGVCESAARYARLQQADAAARLRDLEEAVEQLHLMERQRAEGWREAAHDLRGTVGIISNASTILSRDVSEPLRAQFSQVLHNSVSSLRTLLSDLIDVARLEAGQEQRRVAPFDAALALREFCEAMRSLAAGRDLFLREAGPDSLPVVGDQAKVLRIAQNLVLNAINATQRGGIRVAWEEHGSQWRLCVQDTGPGFTRGSAAPLERALQYATREAQQVEGRAEGAGDATAMIDPAPTLASLSTARPAGQLSGEGIGLSIVKRLCELLNASLELETAPGEGTTFRVTFPCTYQQAKQA